MTESFFPVHKSCYQKSYCIQEISPSFVGLKNTAKIFCSPCIIALMSTHMRAPLSVYTHRYCCHKPVGVQGKFEFMDFILNNTDFHIHILVCMQMIWGFPPPSQRQNLITNICPRMERVLLAPVFPSFGKFRWQKSIRNVALHTDIMLAGTTSP